MGCLVDDTDIALALDTQLWLDTPARFKSQDTFLDISHVGIGGQSHIALSHSRGREGGIDFITTGLGDGTILSEALEPQPTSIRGICVQNGLAAIEVDVGLFDFIRMGCDGDQLAQC